VTIYYVGPGGSDGSNGTSWATRKLTLNGVEDIPVVAGDVVYVGPGIYRELLTCDVSGGNTYSTGTVSVTEDGRVVTGSGTSWSGNVQAGDYLHVAELDTGADGVTNATSTFTAAGGNFDSVMVNMAIEIEGKGVYHISAVGGATSLTLLDTNGVGWPSAGSSLTYHVMSREGSYKIASVGGNTSLTLEDPWTGPTHSGLSYITFRPISYIADVGGENTNGVGGIVRITGSNDDEAKTRATVININTQDYRVFRGFKIDWASTQCLIINGDYIVVEFCTILVDGAHLINMLPTVKSVTIRNCFLDAPAYSQALYVSGTGAHASGVVVENCFIVGRYTFRLEDIGGITVKNCSFRRLEFPFQSNAQLTGSTINVVNCIFSHCDDTLSAVAAGEILESYNHFHECNVDRTNVGVGPGSSDNMCHHFQVPLFYKGIRFPTRFMRPSKWNANAFTEGKHPPYRDLFNFARQAGKAGHGPIQYGEVERDTATVYDGTTSSAKLSDAGRHQLRVPVSNTETHIQVHVYRETNYNGTLPQMVIYEPGQTTRTITDEGVAGAWNRLADTFTPAVGSDYMIVELVSNNTATSGSYAVYFYRLVISAKSKLLKTDGDALLLTSGDALLLGD
jgi:hypothetical protein